MTNAGNKEAVFIDAAKADLDEAVRGLDPIISSRLRMARHRALDAALDSANEKQRVPQKVPWLLPAAGFAAASVGFLALFFLLQSPEQKELASGGMEDLELLASSESIEFYEDLEFYGWLSEQNRAG